MYLNNSKCVHPANVGDVSLSAPHADRVVWTMPCQCGIIIYCILYIFVMALIWVIGL